MFGFGKNKKEQEKVQQQPAPKEPQRKEVPSAAPSKPAEEATAPAYANHPVDKPKTENRFTREAAAPKPEPAPAKAEAPKEKKGFFSRLKEGLFKSRAQMAPALEVAMEKGRKLDESFYEDLMDALILSDMGVQCADEAIAKLKEEVAAKKLQTTDEAKTALINILTAMLDVPKKPLAWPMVILMVGVNGVGKTTTIGKLAMRFQGLGRTVMLCAADTFRAAAADQLQIWAERARCPIVRHKEGADPAGVVFDGVAAAKAQGADLLIVDTAGRLHNKKNLMEEMQKIRRVIDREYPEADVRCLLVVDATTGQNGLAQALAFREAAGINGVVLTKMDGTAKGGCAFPIVRELGVPVRYIGVGEGIEDLQAFRPADFVSALFDREPPAEE